MALGRRTDCTPELTERICALIRDKGAYPEVAAVACGISRGTFYEWLARGRVRSSNSSTPEPGTHGRGDPQGVYAEFADAINKANADLEVAVIVDARAKYKRSRNPLGPIIFASRRFRERWSEQIQVANAGQAAVASMERIKEAWDAPEIVDGEYTELSDQESRTKLENGESTDYTQSQIVANGSDNCALANQSEANAAVAAFHVPPPDADIDAELDAAAATGTDGETEPAPEYGELDPIIATPTNTVNPASHEGIPVEILEIKGKEGK